MSNIGRADAQPISPEVLEVAYQEIEQLQRTISEQAKQIDALEHRLGNQAVTIKTQAATIARMVEEGDINRFRTSVEPPLSTNTVNVSRSYQAMPGEAKAVHPAPNVTIAGGE